MDDGSSVTNPFSSLGFIKKIFFNDVIINYVTISIADSLAGTRPTTRFANHSGPFRSLLVNRFAFLTQSRSEKFSHQLELIRCNPSALLSLTRVSLAHPSPTTTINLKRQSTFGSNFEVHPLNCKSPEPHDHRQHIAASSLSASCKVA